MIQSTYYQVILNLILALLGRVDVLQAAKDEGLVLLEVADVLPTAEELLTVLYTVVSDDLFEFGELLLGCDAGLGA